MELSQKSSMTITRILLEHMDFYDCSGEQRAHSGKKTKMPHLGNVCEVKYSKGRHTMMRALMTNTQKLIS